MCVRALALSVIVLPGISRGFLHCCLSTRVGVTIQQYSTVGRMNLRETGGYHPAVLRGWQDQLREIGSYYPAVLRSWQDDLRETELGSSSTSRLARPFYGKLRVTIQQYSEVGKMILGRNWGLRSSSTPQLARWIYGKFGVTIQQYSAFGKMILRETVGYSSVLHRWLRYNSKIRWGVFRIWGFHSSG
jgi:hypothetical protein